MKLSIITINYNDAKGLEKTINSVISQTFKDFQYIVIDGGSKDESQSVIENYANQISYWVSELDKGIYNAMNKGIAQATGEYVLFINSGDTLYNNDVVSTVIPLLKDFDLISGHTNLIRDGGSLIVKSRQQVTFKDLFRYSIDHPSTFIKRKLFDEIGVYDESLKIISDWKWFIIALAKYNVSYQPIDAIISTFVFDGISSLPENKARLLAERKLVLEKEFPFFIEDYKTLVEYEEPAKNFMKLKNSGWVKLGRKIGLMKNVRF